jgi:hypothetical protein
MNQLLSLSTLLNAPIYGPFGLWLQQAPPTPVIEENTRLTKHILRLGKSHIAMTDFATLAIPAMSLEFITSHSMPEVILIVQKISVILICMKNIPAL